MSGECPQGGQHTAGSVQREGKRSVIRCTKCGAVLSSAELPEG